MRPTRCAGVAFALAVGAAATVAGPPETGGAPPPPGAEVVVARAKDLAAYEAAKAAGRFETGQWVVVADGKVAAKGTSLDEVKGAANDAVHRFVFRVVYGNDRVLGRGKTREEAVTRADAETEFAYHRYLLRYPIEVPKWFIPLGDKPDAPREFDLRVIYESE